MQIIKIDPKKPSLNAIKIAVDIIKKGGVVIYPTDTIYGIGVSALDENSINKVYKIKERLRDKPLSVIMSDTKMIKNYCIVEALQEEVIKSLLPGAFTLILPAKDLKRNKILTIYKETLSIRIPDCEITRMLVKKLKIPFTATSANLSGFLGSNNIQKVLEQLKNKKNQIDLVLDAGILSHKNPSVVIDLTKKNPKIIRR